MLRLTLLLCAGMFATLMIAGEDRGQMRPGLAKAASEGRTAVAKPAPVAPQSAPVILASAPQPAAATVAEVAALDRPEPAPYVEPAREVVQAVEDPVFTLSSLATETVPGADAPRDATAEGLIHYVTASSVNVREAPTTSAPVLGKLENGEAALVITDVDGEWARIVIQGDGMEGYVAMRFLTAQQP